MVITKKVIEELYKIIKQEGVTMMKIGKVKELYRYPVKAMGGERLAEAPILKHGILGDRSFAFKLNSKYLAAVNLPALFAYQARLQGGGNHFGVTVTTDEGIEYHWDDDRLLEHLNKKISDGKLEKVSMNPIEERGAFWEDHILIISSSSLDKVSELCGKTELDVRRFRPNMVIELDSDIPFEEEHWIGKKIIINDSTYVINNNCERCAYVNIDPVNPSIKDPNVLKTIVKERNSNLGVYASVLTEGTVFEDADVLLVDSK